MTPGPILTVNGGSSSLHLAYVTEGSAGEGSVSEGNVGEGNVGEGNVGKSSVGDRMDLAEPPTSAQAMDAVAEFVRDREPPAAVAHRLVHGGERLRHPSLVDDTIRADLETVAALAPLHVPPSLRLLDQLRTLMPKVPHVVCPDNAFHADLPEVAATFPLPASWRSRWGLRRYGFHGLSYAWSTRRTAELLRRPVGELRLVLAHLGGGASVCAVRGGRSVDTSMGFTPLDGVPMSKRSGAVDPGMLLWLLDGRLDVDQLSAGLNHESGLLGLSGGRSGDTRVLVAAAAKGDATAQLAMDVYIHRVRREFAAAATSLDRLDAVVFTGEIGWDQPEVRHGVCAGLSLLGVDTPALWERPDDGPVSAAGSAVPVIVVEPREELQLAIEARALLG